MGPIWDAELRVWDAKNFGLVSPGTHRNKFVKKSLTHTCILKALQKISGTKRLMTLDLGMQHLGCGSYQVSSNDDPKYLDLHYGKIKKI